MTDYRNIDVFYTLELVLENALDTMCAVEGEGQHYDPEDVAAALAQQGGEHKANMLSAFAKTEYLLAMLTSDSIAGDWLCIQQAKEDFGLMLLHPDKLAVFWPSLVQNAKDVKKVAEQKVHVYRQLMQPAYPNDLLTVEIPTDLLQTGVM